MTKREAAIVSAFTGKMLGSFSEMHRYVEEIMGRQVFSHEMANCSIAKQIREKAKPDFVELEVK